MVATHARCMHAALPHGPVRSLCGHVQDVLGPLVSEMNASQYHSTPLLGGQLYALPEANSASALLKIDQAVLMEQHSAQGLLMLCGGWSGVVLCVLC
jgi:hypothetical protein